MIIQESYDFQIDNNQALAWFWALWESAQFCILAKLRTPLGKPQETFTSIEGVLKKYVDIINKLEAATAAGMSVKVASTKSFASGECICYVVLWLYYTEYLGRKVDLSDVFTYMVVIQSPTTNHILI